MNTKLIMISEKNIFLTKQRIKYLLFSQCEEERLTLQPPAPLIPAPCWSGECQPQATFSPDPLLWEGVWEESLHKWAKAY